VPAILKRIECMKNVLKTRKWNDDDVDAIYDARKAY
jgi:hypothetical protein